MFNKTIYTQPLIYSRDLNNEHQNNELLFVWYSDVGYSIGGLNTGLNLVQEVIKGHPNTRPYGN